MITLRVASVTDFYKNALFPGMNWPGGAAMPLNLPAVRFILAVLRCSAEIYE
jgi:hypothetical protein